MRIEDVVNILDRRLPKKTKESGIRLIFYKQLLPSSFGLYKICTYSLYYVDAYNRRRFPLVQAQFPIRSASNKEEEYKINKVDEAFLNGIFSLIEDAPKWESIVRGEYSGSGGEKI